MKSITVNVSNPYNINIGRGLLDNAGEQIKKISSAKTVCLISDTNVYPIYGDRVTKSLLDAGFAVTSYIFPAGEEAKRIATVCAMVEHMASEQLTRDDIAVALGGGVCGDMAGFAASIYLRGIAYVQIPTSLLAQVDSSVGGKTAVDLPQGKNLCGSFHQPSLVLIDPNVLDTLTPHFFSDGMAEVIKTACIKSAPLFERLEREDAKEFIEDIIFECVNIKRIVVENDEHEHGERALLNFGHTPGHAIEKLWNYKTVSHGEAVGMGMIIIASAGERCGITAAGTSRRIANVLVKHGLKTEDTHTLKDIIGAMSADKKRTGNGIKFIFLRKIGDSFVNPVKYDKINSLFGV